MISRCAWCGEFLGEKEPYDDVSETHGMCRACLEDMRERIEATRREGR